VEKIELSFRFAPKELKKKRFILMEKVGHDILCPFVHGLLDCNI